MINVFLLKCHICLPSSSRSSGSCAGVTSPRSGDRNRGKGVTLPDQKDASPTRAGTRGRQSRRLPTGRRIIDLTIVFLKTRTKNPETIWYRWKFMAALLVETDDEVNAASQVSHAD